VGDIRFLLGHVDDLDDLDAADQARIDVVVRAALTVLDEHDHDGDDDEMTANYLYREPDSLLTVAARLGIDAGPILERARSHRDPAHPWRRIATSPDQA
jgi:hypothetical protein